MAPATLCGWGSCEWVAVCVWRCFFPLQSSPVVWWQGMEWQVNTQTSIKILHRMFKNLGSYHPKSQLASRPAYCWPVKQSARWAVHSVILEPQYYNGAGTLQDQHHLEWGRCTHTGTPRPLWKVLRQLSSHSDRDGLQHMQKGLRKLKASLSARCPIKPVWLEIMPQECQRCWRFPPNRWA